jgi:transposase
MWTPATRKNCSRKTTTRYQSDATDEEWRVIEPYLPPASDTGRPREWPLREIVNGIFYVMRSVCPWRQMPKDFPPWSTVYRWFAAWRDACVFEKINHALVMIDREPVGREARAYPAEFESARAAYAVCSLPPCGRAIADEQRVRRRIPFSRQRASFCVR